jgi:hypothetical protein
MFEENEDTREFEHFCRSLDELKEQAPLHQHSEGFMQRILSALPKRPAAQKKSGWRWLKSGISMAAVLGVGLFYWKKTK